MGDTVVKDEVTGIPVVEAVGLPAQLIVQHEIVVRPFEAVSETCRETDNLHLTVMAQDVPCQVGVGLTGIICRNAERSRLLTEEPRLTEAG